ncbi:MAG: lipoyl synthase [Candidatus Goldbacteria bacterium]|nr:lipoyl synthase [Candidatus Goldiibacteriota bacterium]
MNERKPEWLQKKINFNDLHETQNFLIGKNIHTICHQARCPNISECFSQKIATFLILGDICTRGCIFCNVKKGIPEKKTFTQEIEDILAAIKEMKLKFVVITSVTRDDLDDGGASVFCEIINRIRDMDSSIKVETLVPDFKGNKNALSKIFNSKPDVFSHNLETIPSLYHLRNGAIFDLSMDILKQAKSQGLLVKTGIMLGLGEDIDEVVLLLKELREIDCDFISIGQYLSPTKEHYPVKKYIEPEIFAYLKRIAMLLGFKYVESGPYVRSSYMASNYLNKVKI